MKHKRRTIVCIFSHPDDEAFGPSGTIAKLAKEADVYLLCATKGQAGQDSTPAERESLGRRRAAELRRSAEVLGVKAVHFLGYRDGYLCNNIYHALADKITVWLKKYKPVTLLTFEMRGISGHIDHIAVSMVTTYAFYKLPFVKKLMYYCLTEDRRGKDREYFIYFPPGYKKTDIGETIDVSEVWDIKVKAMMQHEAQQHDARRILEEAKKFPKEENFIVVTK